MKQTKAPESTPSPKQGAKSSTSGVGQDINPSSIFISLVLDMSWRLAIVILVPIIGFFELDKHFKTQPVLTIVGVLVAITGMTLVLKRTLKETNALVLPSPGAKK